MVRPREENSNWRGGISFIRSADDLLLVSAEVIEEVKQRVLRYKEVDSRTGCWNWTGSTFRSNGRACLHLGTRLLASRVSYVVHRGQTNSLLVLHKCDNVLCVNPDHLWLGTNSDNSADMVRKGRQACGGRNGAVKYPERLIRGEDHINRRHPERVRGERNGRALLTDEQVRVIKRKFRPYRNCKSPSNAKELAREYGVAVHVISLIGRGETWKHVSI
jgi:hypothetical protein